MTVFSETLPGEKEALLWFLEDLERGKSCMLLLSQKYHLIK
jgi:hypothetical protein